MKFVRTIWCSVIVIVVGASSASADTVRAWGANGSGQCSVPSGLGQCAAVAAGSYHSMAIQASTGQVVCWGDNTWGQSSAPADLGACTAISGGGGHSLALRVNQTIRAWGRGNYGQNASPDASFKAVAIAAGGDHNAALLVDGTVIAWASNDWGERNVPSSVQPARAVTSGIWHKMAITQSRTVVAWGRNNYGQCNVPSGLLNVIGIAAGQDSGGGHSAALCADGTVVCWGKNSSGQCNVPAGLSGAVAVFAGGDFTGVVRADGSLSMWGINASGQCAVPSGLPPVLSIAASDSHVVALVRERANLDLHVPAEYATIQAAVDASQDGDVIRVAPGTYVESVDMRGRNVAIEPADDLQGFDWDAPALQRSVRCVSGEASGCVFRGIRFRGDGDAGVTRGGVMVSASSPKFENCSFTGIGVARSEGSWGGAVDVVSGSPAFIDCTWQRCRTIASNGGDGGALLVRGGSVSVLRGHFSSNMSGQGSDLFAVGPAGTVVTMESCEFTGAGGGGFGARIYNYGSGADAVQVRLDSCVFHDIAQPAISLIHGWDTVVASGVKFLACRVATTPGAPSVLMTQSRSRLTFESGLVRNCSASSLFGADGTQGGNIRITGTAFCGNSPTQPDWGAGLVDAGGNAEDCGPVLRVPSDFAKIQDAIDALSAIQGTIDVSAGTYHETIDLRGKIITINSAGSRANTILDGTGLSGSVVRATTGETAATVLQGFTIRNGKSGTLVNGQRIGGGMVVQNASLTISDCAFFSNSADAGGGLAAINSHLVIDGCTFSTNTAGTGGGLWLDNGLPNVTNCVISDNTVAGHGGGLYATPLPGQLPNALLSGNTVCGNASGDAGRTNVWALFEDSGNTICDCFGDVDGNGVTDTADISLTLLFFGSATDPDFIQPDQDMNGFVDTADIALLLLNFGQCT